MMAGLHRGVPTALLAALLFGVSAPLGKLLLGRVDPWMLAALLYLGAGTGLWAVRQWRGPAKTAMASADRPWLAGAIVCGGMVAPVLLMYGLAHVAASQASLLLNLEGVFTALLAWVVFKENVDRRIALGMAVIVMGATLLSWAPSNGSEGPDGQSMWPSLAIVLACLAWAVDNNLTRKVALNDASFIAQTKGLVSGSTNLVLAWMVGAHWPGWPVALPAALLGLVSYGVSLVLFVVAMRHLGASRAGAYFSVAPFFGALVSIGLLNEPLTWPLILAACLMGLGIYLHASEQHMHEHKHEPLAHAHEHEHDEHHQHAHDAPVEKGARHSHWHRHEPITHLHAHHPDAHHRHRH